MKNFTKALLLTLTLSLLVLVFSLPTLAEGGNLTKITVGETINPQTEGVYTLEEAWAFSEECGDGAEVVVKCNNENFADTLSLVNVSGKKTTLFFCDDIATTTTVIVAKNCKLTLDLSGFTFAISHQIGIHTSAVLNFRSSVMGARVENRMDYAPFAFAPSSSLVFGQEGEVITLHSAKLFETTEVSAKAHFTNTAFEGVSLLLEQCKNVAVTFGGGCTFHMQGKGGIHEYGNTFLSENIALCEGYVLAHSEREGVYMTLQDSDAVKLTFVLEGEEISVFYKRGAKVKAPAILGGGVTLNGNYYYPEYDKDIQEFATEDATYTLRYNGGGQLSGNYTLNTAIDFHAYIRATDEITHINGIPVAELDTELAGGNRFYKITFPLLAPKDAHDSQLVRLTVNLGMKTVTVDRFISLVGYAEAAVESNLGEEIIDLVLRTMDYINKANIYFGGKSVERIDALLESQNFKPYEWVGENVREIGRYENLRGACLDLNQTPGYVFYVRADYEGDVVINGKAYHDYSEVRVMGGQAVKYVVVSLPAYQMTEDITVVAGEDSLVYNLDTYIAGVASHQPYAHAFYGYVMACKNYIGTES